MDTETHSFNKDWLDEVSWNSDGLVAAIAQDHQSGEILMQAWMSREALALTIEQQVAVYWSRSRQKLWRKGESSGNTQRLVECRLDCDGDSLLLLVEQEGGVACHTGRKSCFYRKLDAGHWTTVAPVLKDPDGMYG